MENNDLEFKNQKIVDVKIEKEVKTSFMNYAMSVIMSRALPDVRDGLKPVHRRILYAMYEDKLTYDKPFRKSATTVGNVLGRYHPHGDTAVYDTMVRMAQPFSLRYCLIDGKGNFGNIDGDDAAAYRYTEARMSKLADEMLVDIEKDVVDFAPNFDNKFKEPTVLPSRFPNLLVNGSVGIAVGMATNIPPHNLSEVIDGTLHLMDNPDATVDDLMEFIKGPDFPTRALICGTAGIREAYRTGKGRVRVRARATIDEDKRKIIFTEIPYQVNKVKLVQAIADCYKDKKVEGLTYICDESGKAGLRVVVDYRRDANPQVILNQLYRHTSLEDTFAINMLALVDGVPRVLGLKDMLELYIAHQEDVLVRRLNFDLDRAQRELHIFEGYRVAIENIDRVIEIIKGSSSIADAKQNLSLEFGLSDAQTQAIVEMTLGRLSGLERQKIEDRIAKITQVIAEITGTLADNNKIREIIKNDLQEIKRKFGDERMTEITFDGSDIDDEDLIEKHTCVITMTHSGYIKRMSADSYNAQARGGKGIKGITTKEEDFVEHMLALNSHSHLMLFTNTGKIFVKKAYRIPEASRTAKGTNIVNLVEVVEGEKITAMISVSEFVEGDYLLMVTKKGIVKRTAIKEYEYQRKGGKIALNLDDGDELVYVRHTSGSDEIIIATHDGNAIRFDENSARVVGRTARGVRGIRLREGDFVSGVALVDDEKTLLTLTENGYGKRCEFSEFTARHRGGLGVKVHNLTDKTGALVGIAAVAKGDDIVLVTNDGITIRLHSDDISCYSRTASGVIVMRASEGSVVASFANVGNDENEVEEVAAPADFEHSDTEKTAPVYGFNAENGDSDADNYDSSPTQKEDENDEI